MGLQSNFRFMATCHAMSTLFLYYTLSNGRYFQFRLCLHAKSTTNHMWLSHTTDYGRPAKLWDYDQLMIFLGEVLRQKTVERYCLDHLLPLSYRTDDTSHHFQSLE